MPAGVPHVATEDASVRSSLLSITIPSYTYDLCLIVQGLHYSERLDDIPEHLSVLHSSCLAIQSAEWPGTTGGIFRDPGSLQAGLGGTYVKLQLIALYDDPDVFRPERFLESQYGTKMGADVTDLRDNLAFGAGRVSTYILKTN